MKREWEEDYSRLNGMHMCEIIREDKIETLNKKEKTTSVRHYKRSKCIICRRQVNTCCEQCKIYLCCTQNETFGMTCWKAFHTLPEIILY